MIFEITATVFFCIMTVIVLIFYKMNAQSQGMMLDSYKKVLALITDFREELHKTVDSAIDAHVKKYHS